MTYCLDLFLEWLMSNVRQTLSHSQLIAYCHFNRTLLVSHLNALGIPYCPFSDAQNSLNDLSQSLSVRKRHHEAKCSLLVSSLQLLSLLQHVMKEHILT